MNTCTSHTAPHFSIVFPKKLHHHIFLRLRYNDIFIFVKHKMDYIQYVFVSENNSRLDFESVVNIP